MAGKLIFNMAAKLTKKKLSVMRALIQQFGFFTSLLLQLHGLIYVFALFKKYRDDKLLMYYIWHAICSIIQKVSFNVQKVSFNVQKVSFNVQKTLLNVQKTLFSV